MKFICALVTLCCITLSETAFAQNKPIVAFKFQLTPINDSTQRLYIKTSFNKDFALFPSSKNAISNLFISSIKIDSTNNASINNNDSIVEIGSFITEKLTDGTIAKLYKDSATFIYTIHVEKNQTKLKGSFVWLGKIKDEFPSGEEPFNLAIATNKVASANIQQASNSKIAIKPLWKIFLITLATGLLAILTPCVFPLVPVTVSFFLKRSGSKQAGIRNAVIYSLSIIGIYTIPTIILTLIFGDSVLYTIATSAISNLLFFVIFIVFAISFFGAFEINLPNSWANKADENANKEGILGIFFMALTLVIVSFSCTGPIVGTLLGQTSTQGIGIAPIIGMFGFGVGLALPFSLFAFFPSMLQSLPKSGGWLNSVKVSFGFIELALAFKFLSSVDLIYHLHLLDRDVFLVLWIVIFGLLGQYLLGKLKFSHDSVLQFISVPRLFFAIASFSFALYMVPGLWGAPLKPLSGFIPPATSQDFNLEDLKYSINSNSTTPNKSANVALPPNRYTNILKVPFGLTAYYDLNEGMAAAKALKKPIMLDFTGHSCANCRKIEEQVWKNPEVLDRIKNYFVLVSLYVDEPTELPIEEQYTNAEGKKIVTVGEKNLDYESTKFGFNAQPLYMFLDLNGNALSSIKSGYNPDVNDFVKHLDDVKKAFSAR